MNHKSKIIRETLRQMPVSNARKILEPNLPPNEYKAVYFADVMQETLCYIADVRLNCSESMVKKYRTAAYKKLAAVYFLK